MAERSYDEIMLEAIAAVRAMPDGPGTVVTDLIPKNVWEKKFKENPEYGDIEFVGHSPAVGQEKSTGGTPNSGNLGRGRMRKRPTFED